MHRLLHCAMALGLAVAASAQAVTLYDPANGLPTAQGWNTLTIGALGSEGVAAGVYALDSTGLGVDTYGKARFSPIALDTAAGFALDFTLRIASESHVTNDRAGFSMLFVGANPAHSLELAFWTNEVFAYHFVGGSFVHGIGAATDTTASLRSYMLTVANQQYTLTAGGQALFGGNLQDYTPQGLPYTMPGFMFFGDNTSSGSARVELGAIQLTTAVPEPGQAGMLAIGLAIHAWRARRRR